MPSRVTHFCKQSDPTTRVTLIADVSSDLPMRTCVSNYSIDKNSFHPG